MLTDPIMNDLARSFLLHTLSIIVIVMVAVAIVDWMRRH